ncbi:MAG: TlyA family RNA methyltransferase [Burkholderiaceae bacterium]
MRADRLIVERGLARSRTLARRLIEAGSVSAFDGRGRALPVKPATELAPDTRIELTAGELDTYVSRGGLKLAGAIRGFDLDVRGWHCLDAGQSTGGFTDCLLQHGAAFVCGIDVGHDQLDPALRKRPEVRAIERTNIRHLDPAGLARLCPEAAAHPFELIVADLSFISLRLVLPALAGLAQPGAVLVALVKPQFEAGREALDGRGIVRSDAAIMRVRSAIDAAAGAAGWAVRDWIASPIDGGDGNREFFILARRKPTPTASPTCPVGERAGTAE